MLLNIAMNYGGRKEIVEAIKVIVNDVNSGKLDIEQIDENTVSERMYNNSCPDPDLIIRPGGEYRISNFLLWQSAYAEYAVVDTLWPDFKPSDLDEILLVFSTRKRRFGGI
jgi:undecaprenyl diphosphate synthase